MAKKKIVLLYQDETSVVTHIVQRLRDHFGTRRIIANGDHLPVIKDDDIVVILLSQTGAAYRNRAQVATKLGLLDQAQQDEKMASDLTPFMNIFGGIFPWW